MTYLLPFLSLCILAAFICLVTPGRATAAPSIDAVRCQQLIDYYERYSPGRSAHSDGKRNMTRLGAGIDCDRGDHAKGIDAMEALLAGKKFALPPAPSTMR